MTTHTCTYPNIKTITHEIIPRRCTICGELETIESLLEWENKKVIQQLFNAKKNEEVFKGS